MTVKNAKIIVGCQNLVISVLIIGIILMLGNLLLKDITYAYDGEGSGKGVSLEENHKPGTFLITALNHIFPGINGGADNSAAFIAIGAIRELTRDMVLCNFKNPMYYVRTQFPAIALIAGNDFQNVVVVKDVPPENEVSEATEVASIGAIEKDRDDMGDERTGIYLSQEEGIIDSLLNLNIEIENMPNPIFFEPGKPHILIYHTHGTEAYKPASEGNFHTLKQEYSVMRIGEILTEELENRGFNVIHDTTYHNYPSFSGSYQRSMATAKRILEEHPSIRVVLDVHRDGYNHIETNPNKQNIIRNNQTTINGKTTSRFQLVIGSETPNRTEVESFARLIKAISDELHPGFSKPILLKPYGRFNQFLSDHYALLEVGSNANTIEEAKLTAKYLAEIIAIALNKLSN